MNQQVAINRPPREVLIRLPKGRRLPKAKRRNTKPNNTTRK